MMSKNMGVAYKKGAAYKSEFGTCTTPSLIHVHVHVHVYSDVYSKMLFVYQRCVKA